MGRRKKEKIDPKHLLFYFDDDGVKDEERRKRVLSRNIKRYRKKTIVSGDRVEVMIYPTWNNRSNERRAREMMSSEEQMMLNARNRRKHLERLILCNFSAGDLWVTLGYKKGNEPDCFETAQKHIQNYFRALKRIAKIEGFTFKYIYVTEQSSSGRFHHHVLMNFPDREMAEKKWKHGAYSQSRRLEDTGDHLEGLAAYLLKDVQAKKHRRSYGYSKNLAKPKVKIVDFAVTKKKALELAESHVMRERYISGDGCYTLQESTVNFSDFFEGVYLYFKAYKIRAHDEGLKRKRTRI